MVIAIVRKNPQCNQEDKYLIVELTDNTIIRSVKRLIYAKRYSLAITEILSHSRFLKEAPACGIADTDSDLIISEEHAYWSIIDSFATPESRPSSATRMGVKHILIERRRFRRYPVYIPIEYECKDKSIKGLSITLNLSEGGALISSKRPLEIASRLIIKILMKDQVFYILSRVVHIQHEIMNKLYNVGIEFLKPPFEFVKRFYEEIEALEIYRKQLSSERGRSVSLYEASMEWYGTSPAH